MIYWPNCRCIECQVNRALRWAFIVAVLGLLFSVLWFGCSSTVTPAAVNAQQASFDQGGQNSGLISMLPGNAGAIITPHARDRYNELLGIYGSEFLPALKPDDGISPRLDGNYDITAAALENFILVAAWHRMGREPKSK